MLRWMSDHQPLLWSIGGASVAIFIASLIIIPILVVRIRPDYFALQKRPASRWAKSSPLVRAIVLIGKNLLGSVLMVAGLAMLVLPGQGMLTILVGFFLLDFPGKYRLERWLVSRRAIGGLLNWLRSRAGRAPLVFWKGGTE